MRRTYLLLIVILLIVFMFHGCIKPPAPNQLWQYAGYVKDIDGNVYLAIKLGNQIWTTNNLRVTHFRNGDHMLEPDTLVKYVCYDDIQKAIYGCYYSWDAINDPRGLTPEGWHVPTNEEWMELVEYLGGFSYAGGKMKEVAYNFWKSPNTGATNSSLFCARPSGWYGYYELHDIGYFARFWSSTEIESEDLSEYAWSWFLFYDSREIDYDYINLENFQAIRMIKDQPNNQEE